MSSTEDSTPRSLRIGAVGYLNSKPLVEGLQSFLPSATLEFDMPASLAIRMKSGEFDVGLIPAVEFLGWERSTYIPGLCVGSFGTVLSVCVHSRKPFGQIQSMALDAGSRTSIALMKVIFHENGWQLEKTKPFPLESHPEENIADAVLLIGDRAMIGELEGYPFKMDLGDEWKRLTGLPFVFALWAVRPGLKLTTPQTNAFHQALRLGKENIKTIAYREATALGKNPEKCLNYLTKNIKFDLGNSELEGLTLFQAKLISMGLIHQRIFHEVDQLNT